MQPFLVYIIGTLCNSLGVAFHEACPSLMHLLAMDVESPTVLISMEQFK